MIYCGKSERKISILTNLDYYKRRSRFASCFENVGILKLDLDEECIDWAFESQKLNQDVYICYQDQIIFTNAGNQLLLKSYDEISKKFQKKCSSEKYLLRNNDWKIYVVSKEDGFWYRALAEDKAVLVFLLLNIFVPIYLMIRIERNMIKRIELLEKHFSIGNVEIWSKTRLKELNQDEQQMISIQSDVMCPLEGDYGRDEIGRLIAHYNCYIQYLKQLTIRESKQREVRIALELSKKQAEINALTSQVNPHFLYNSIESICMRSVLKGEYETAGIMRDLSMLLREVSSWDNEVKPLYKEIEFIKHYLKIQKYRFGNKIDCKIKIDEECKNVEVPKLCILTFVENACVHGIEDSLENGVISIDAFRKDDSYFIQINDNGVGMTKDEQDVVLKRLENISIESFKTSKSTGIMNAYLRLQMLYGDKFQFFLDSEKEVGTTIQLQIRMNGVTSC